MSNTCCILSSHLFEIITLPTTLMASLSGHIFAFVLLALALIHTDPFSLTIHTPSSWLLVGEIFALAYLLCLEQNRQGMTPISLPPARFPEYQQQPRLEDEATPGTFHQRKIDADVWIQTVQKQRNTILRLHDQVTKEKRHSEHLSLRLKEEQTRSAKQHPIATKSRNPGDSRKILDLKQTIVDLAHKFQYLEKTFGDRLEESRKLIKPGFEEEVKRYWILLSRSDDWQAMKEVGLWCHNHGLEVVEAATYNPIGTGLTWLSYGGGQQAGFFSSSHQFPIRGVGFLDPSGSVSDTRGSTTQHPSSSGGFGAPTWSSVTDLSGTDQSNPEKVVPGRLTSNNSPGFDTPGPTSRIDIPGSEATPSSTSRPTPDTGMATLGRSTIQATVATSTTLKDLYPVSVKSEHGKPETLHIDRATGTLRDLGQLWRKACEAKGQPAKGSFEWTWKGEEETVRVGNKRTNIAGFEGIPVEYRKDGMILSVVDFEDESEGDDEDDLEDW